LWNSQWFFETTPVDFVAKSIVQFAMDDTHTGKVYHMVLRNPISADAVFKSLQKMGQVADLIGLDEWQHQLSLHTKNDDDMMSRLLAETLETESQYMTEQTDIDCSEFEVQAAFYDLKRPVTDAAYLANAYISMH
jgi:hypothetical protein